MPAWLIPALMAAGGLFSGAAKGSADQRRGENQETGERNRLLAMLHGQQQNATLDALGAGSRERLGQGALDLDRRQFALNAPSTRANQSVRGSILQNAQPFTVSGLPAHVQSRIPQLSGGLTPAMFSADTRALGGEMSRKALLDQMAGDTFDPQTPTDFKSGILPMPKMEDYQRSGFLEKLLGGLGLGASLAGGVGSVIEGARGRRVPLDNPFDAAG